MTQNSNKSSRRDFFSQAGMIATGITLSVVPSIYSCRKVDNTLPDTFIGDAPRIMVCFSWSRNNIGDIAIIPGLLRSTGQYIPEAEVVIVASSRPEEYKTYLSERKMKCRVVASPFNPNVNEITPEFREEFDRADLLLFNSGTTISYGRWEYNWNRTLRYAMPLFMARETGKPFGIYCQSFERFAWPSNELFRPLLNDASFLFVRDGNSLEYLKSLDIAPSIMQYGPDSTFAFNLHDEIRANAFLNKHALKPRQFIIIIIRSGHQRFIDEKRENDHAAKLRQLIEIWVERTGHDVLICPEVIHEIEPARRLLLDQLSDKTRQNVRFRDTWWEPDEAFVIYEKAEVIVSMEMHSIILGLAAGTPILHPRFVEAGRKAWMLRDLGIEEWLFDIDKDSVEQFTTALLDIHNDYDTALAKVKSAMKIVHKGQQETMEIVRSTLLEAVRNRSSY